MFRYPRGYKPGIPTMSPEEERRWMVAALTPGGLAAWNSAHRDEGYIDRDTLRARGMAMGMDESEVMWHLSAY